MYSYILVCVVDAHLYILICALVCACWYVWVVYWCVCVGGGGSILVCVG